MPPFCFLIFHIVHRKRREEHETSVQGASLQRLVEGI